jgi:hypothetical protein
VTTTAQDLDAQVKGWRFQMLFEAGWPLADAKLIARRSDIDLHYAVQVLKKCPDPALARRLVL